MSGSSAPIGCDHAVICEETDERYVLHVSGELDLATAPLLETHLEAAWASATPAVVLDLEGVTFLDSTGVRVILQAHQTAVADSRRFSLRRLPPQARMVCELVGVPGRVPIDD